MIFKHFETIDSTNNALIQAMKANPVPWTVYWSSYQMAGRGQSNATWQSEPFKNILMSFYVCPSIHLTELVNFNAWVSVVLHDYLEALGIPVTIKWPNDIYYQDQKLAGILIEGHLQSNTLKGLIVGIGLNVNQQIWDNGINATSICQITSKPWSLIELLQGLMEAFHDHYDALNENWLDRFNQHLYKRHEWVWFESKQGVFQGQIIEVDANGDLVLAMQSGEYHEFKNKSIKILFKPHVA